MVRLTSAFAGLSICLLFAAACGDEGGQRLSKDEYLNRIRQLESSDTVREATAVYTEMAAEIRLSQSDCAGKARTLHSDLEKIVDQVNGLRPPAEVQALQDRFVAASRQTVNSIGSLADEIRKGDLTCGQPFNQRAYGLPSTERAEEVIAELGRKGYTFGLNSGD